MRLLRLMLPTLIVPLFVAAISCTVFAQSEALKGTTPTPEKARPTTQPGTIKLRAWGVPNPYALGVSADADRRVLLEFRKQYPWIDPISPTGLTIPGSRSMDMVPMMQIAGDIAP